MRLARSTFASAIAVMAMTHNSHAQSCCAGSGAITPGRLSLHEVALVGVQTKSSVVFGNFDSHGSWTPNAKGSSEADFEQDFFAAARVLPRAQLALIVPLVETWRTAGVTDFGGGIGDANVSGRADVVVAGESRYVPGIAFLAGVTLPTGRPPESAKNKLAADATGVGALTGNFGLALEQNFGAWLVSVSGLVAFRASRSVGDVTAGLSPQFTALFALGYSFKNDAALALIVSYAGEGNGRINGESIMDSSRRTLLMGTSGVWPINDTWRVQGGFFVHPPVEPFGRNQPTAAGLTLTLIKSWT